jgi:amino acid permease
MVFKKHLNSIIKYAGFLATIAGLIISFFGLLSDNELKRSLFAILFSSYIIITICVVCTFIVIIMKKKELDSTIKIMDSVNKFSDDIIFHNHEVIKKNKFKYCFHLLN